MLTFKIKKKNTSSISQVFYRCSIMEVVLMDIYYLLRVINHY